MIRVLEHIYEYNNESWIKFIWMRHSKKNEEKKLQNYCLFFKFLIWMFFWIASNCENILTFIRFMINFSRWMERGLFNRDKSVFWEMEIDRSKIDIAAHRKPSNKQTNRSYFIRIKKREKILSVQCPSISSKWL